MQSENQDTVPNEDLASVFNDENYVKSLQATLLQFARMQLSDHQLAEDAVQEALIGAMKNAQSFHGRAAFKTWVFAILKNKIADILRKRHHSAEINNQGDDDSTDEEQLSRLFNERGHWHKGLAPNHWHDPEHAFKQEQFWRVLETCLEKLPARQAKVFLMRETLGLDSEEICAQEGLSTSNLHVLLYRARMRLQTCLEMRWFSEEDRHA